ncbi:MULTISPECIES: type 1 glutamine amidotransferase domain-containing protein [Bacillus]|uniref:type 1 glutamine amidotransferase domain-containing protein n=1 Tax=Bacillus TaxID=1386 RepID=UPI001966C7FC|nr:MULTISPECIES: type 1 glutamine amidotransferase domain-containing protein [Bacillus]MDI0274323.1 type 1 glutamine amidotransferase domain-containing protein [Bacillus safensis]QRY36644.1 type 1 glutamine amidotransferase domain-containing protein [Bacillus sp. PDNC022]UQZ94797.1 type 1 glutamine amidotransferase domain-containing protein [Bacillus safensis]UXO88001.1 type 1 glutamine amidotransferase domain-containing protein [Bacillus safensis]WCL57721.1 type 1 glutamine amidotransferase d
MSKKVLLVSTSSPEMNGHPTGLWLEELAEPFHIFKENELEVQIVSIQGGTVPIDKNSIPEGVPAQYQDVYELLQDTKALTDVNPSDYDGIFFAGGHGPMIDFASNQQVADAILAVSDKNGAIGAVCHGVSAFVDVKDQNGKSFIEGKKITGFTNEEEDAVQLTSKVPFLLETKLREQGASFEKGDAFAPFAVVDGQIITGQNPGSSAETARLFVKTIS